jgi:hypothetical protein
MSYMSEGKRQSVTWEKETKYLTQNISEFGRASLLKAA